MPNERPNPQISINPLLWLAVSFSIGIATDHVFQFPLTTALAVTVILAFAALFFRQRSIATALVVAAFAALGVVCASIERADISPDRLKVLHENSTLRSGDPVEVEGTLDGSPETAPEGLLLTLTANRIVSRENEIPVSGNVRLFLPVETEDAKRDVDRLELEHGTRIRVACRLEREDRFLNPGVARRTDLLHQRGIDATANIKSPLLIEKLGRDPVFIPLAFVYELRANLIDKFRTSFSPQTAGILIASMFGNKHFLDKQTADVFREGGTFHVLVISGLHITFIGGFILVIVRLFFKDRRIQSVLVLAILWLCGIAVGGEAPVIRACVMFTILMIGYASYRNSTLLNSLGACVLVLLAWRPRDLFDPSFQLTVLSVAAIVGFGLPILTKLRSIGSWMPSTEEPFPPNVPSWLRRLCETIYWREAAWNIERGRQIWSAQIFKKPLFQRIDDLGLRRILIFVFDGIVISIAVQIFLLPLLVYYFHRVSFASVLLNLWVGPLLAIESISALLAVLVGSMSNILAVPFATLTEVLNWLLISVPSLLTNSSWASVRIPLYSGAWKSIYFVYFLPVIALAVWVIRWDPFSISRPTKRAILGPSVASLLIAILAGLIIFHPFSAGGPDGRLHIEFLDVGQGDAAFITFPGGGSMLVDAGGRVNYGDGEGAFEPDVPRIGEAVVSEFLWERGLSRIDHIVATHADTDHIQGLVDVAKNLSVGRAYFGRLDNDDPELSELLSVLDRFGVPKTLVSAGETFEIDGVRIEVLNPSQNTQLSANNDSVVLRIVYGDVSFLLTGDIERDAEAALVASGAVLSSTVLKVPHHGSRTSSTQGFVDAVVAKYAVISVGRRSVFGHPHPEIFERLNLSGSNVMITGESGTITFSTDGKTFDVRTFVNKQ